MEYLPLIAAAVSTMVWGTLWYGPLFSKPWIKLMGGEEALKKNARPMGLLYGTAFAGALIEAYVLTMFLDYAGATTIQEGMMVAFWGWLGFTATTMWANYSFSGKATNLYLIDAGYHLAVLLTMGAILVSI
jgi:hypothetical protein